jgi:hypothetical protein
MNISAFNIINKIYSNAGFLEKYGGSLWIMIIIILVFFVAISYYYVLNNIQPIKSDWLNQRCSPSVMPFAGLINKPDDQTVFQFTASNFTNCINTTLTDIVNIALAPIYYLVDSLVDIFNSLVDAIQSIRSITNTIRSSLANVSKEVMGRILNFLIPLQHIMIKINNMFQQTQAVMTTGIYTLLGTYNTMITAVTSIVKIITSILISLAGIIVVLFAVPFGLGVPFAIPLLSLFILILIPGMLVWVIDMMILKKFVNPLPGIPTCFDGDILLELHTTESIKLKNIKPGMILKNNNVVTAVMEMACLDKVYKLGQVICTGEHKVMYNNKWIKCKDHPYSILIDKNYEKVYCINTSHKIIDINGIIFGDYDELDNSEIKELKLKCNKYLPNTFDLVNIHKYLDGGFTKDTPIELFDGSIQNINNIKVNDVLKFGERVIGIVKIKADDLKVNEYNLENNTKIKAGPNVHICDTDLGRMSTLDMYGETIKVNNLYHLITDKKIFHINNIKYYDYNGCIDKFLDLEQVNLIKALI